jgi:hypothetical protein
MKKLYFLFILLISSSVSFGQTTLAAGDIAIISLQGDDPDDFAFVTFVNIDATTGIYFTDCGADASGFRSPACTEGAYKYTVPTGGLSKGDIVRFSTSTDFASYSDTRITGSFNVAASGDQVIAFQDSTSAIGGTTAAQTPTFLFVIQIASTLFTGDPADTNQTGLPAGLSDTGSPRSAIGVGASTGTQSEFDNVVYNGSYDFSSEANDAASLVAAKIAMTDPANYLGENDFTDATYLGFWSAIPSALTLSTVLSVTKQEIANFSTYPNPVTNGEFFINSASNAAKDVQIYDMLGKQVYAKNVIANERVNVANLNTGIYILKVIEEGKTATRKLVIK